MKFIFCFFLVSATTFGVVKKGVEFPETIPLGKKELVLNGVGLREATIFKVDVYVAGLYLETKSVDPKEILSSQTPKKLDLHFLRDVPKDKLIKAWEDGFRNNCADYFKEIEKDMGLLISFTSDSSKGDLLSMVFVGPQVELSINGKAIHRFDNPKFSQGLLSVWLGKSPISDTLQKQLLGLETL